MKYTASPGNTGNEDLGSKALNLIKLAEHGFSVPSFFCIRSEALSGVLPFAEIKKLYDDITENPQRADALLSCLRGRAHDVSFVLPDEAEDLIDSLDESGLYAVRSSSLLEDSGTASFAGQFDTFLNVPKDSIRGRILDCFCSLFSPQVLHYCINNNIDPSELKMNIIIQKMIRSDISGVVFTANPLGILNESVIISGRGLGDKAAEGTADVSTYYYNLTDKIWYCEKNGDSAELTDGNITELTETAQKIKQLIGFEADIEYAVSDGTIYILQARPITALNTEVHTVLDNSNISESYPGITLPLTYSAIRRAYGGIFGRLTARVIKNKKTISEFSPVFSEMIQSANGRIYYKINNWYTLIEHLPFSRKIMPVWQDMMGVSEKKVDSGNKKLSFFTGLRICLNYIKEFIRADKNMRALEKRFSRLYEGFRKDISGCYDCRRLLEIYWRIEEEILLDWDVTLVNDMYAFVFTGLVKNLLKKSSAEDPEKITNDYISGITDIESIKPVKELIRLSRSAQQRGMTEYLRSIADRQQAEDYLSSSDETAEEIRNFIELYGDRSAGELKLESPTFRTNPEILTERIAEYADAPEPEYKEQLRKDDLLKKSGLGAIKRMMLRFCSEQAAKGIRNREISRLDRSRIYGLLRMLFLQAGSSLKKQACIDDERDIFYLTDEDISAYLSGNLSSLRTLVSARKSEYAVYELLPAFSRLVFSSSSYDKKHHMNISSSVFSEEISEIFGSPCSNGTAEGEVLVIEDPGRAKNTKDKILVTKMTDPGWVFLIASAKGVISEKGSLLSHTAIVSRELGIPSITGVKNITDILKSGDRIIMNGNTGEIKILK